jgi:hypothetical protein
LQFHPSERWRKTKSPELDEAHIARPLSVTLPQFLVSSQSAAFGAPVSRRSVGVLLVDVRLPEGEPHWAGGFHIVSRDGRLADAASDRQEPVIARDRDAASVVEIKENALALVEPGRDALIAVIGNVADHPSACWLSGSSHPCGTRHHRRRWSGYSIRTCGSRCESQSRPGCTAMSGLDLVAFDIDLDQRGVGDFIDHHALRAGNGPPALGPAPRRASRADPTSRTVRSADSRRRGRIRSAFSGRHPVKPPEQPPVWL